MTPDLSYRHNESVADWRRRPPPTDGAAGFTFRQPDENTTTHVLIRHISDYGFRADAAYLNNPDSSGVHREATQHPLGTTNINGQEQEPTTDKSTTSKKKTPMATKHPRPQEIEPISGT